MSARHQGKLTAAGTACERVATTMLTHAWNILSRIAGRNSAHPGCVLNAQAEASAMTITLAQQTHAHQAPAHIPMQPMALCAEQATAAQGYAIPHWQEKISMQPAGQGLHAGAPAGNTLLQTRDRYALAHALNAIKDTAAMTMTQDAQAARAATQARALQHV
jgi:hypothetical protein